MADVQPPGGGDMVEVEHEGQVYAIPAALEGAFLAHADHEARARDLDDREQTFHAAWRSRAQAAELAEQDLADRAQLHMLDLQLASYEGLDWAFVQQEDPDRAYELWRQFQQTRAMRDAFANDLAHGQDQRRMAAERARAAELTEAGKVLSKEIEGWSPEVAKKLVDYAAAFGVTLEELRGVADHRLWRILHRAFQGDEASKQQATSKAAEQAQAVRPALVVAGGAASGGGVRDELATGEWMRRRNAQLAG